MVEFHVDCPSGPRRASVLAAAHTELIERCEFADAVSDWQERAILSALADVADYVKRVGNHPESSHYRAEKAGALLHAAARLQRETVLAYAGWPEDGDEERAILAAAELLEAVSQQIQAAMGLFARRARGDSSDFDRYRANELAAVVRRFAKWATELIATAEPDPIGD